MKKLLLFLATYIVIPFAFSNAYSSTIDQAQTLVNSSYYVLEEMGVFWRQTFSPQVTGYLTRLDLYTNFNLSSDQYTDHDIDHFLSNLYVDIEGLDYRVYDDGSPLSVGWNTFVSSGQGAYLEAGSTYSIELLQYSMPILNDLGVVIYGIGLGYEDNTPYHNGSLFWTYDWIHDDNLDINWTEYTNRDLAFVTYMETVPIPGAIWLLGSGLIGLVGIRKKF